MTKPVGVVRFLGTNCDQDIWKAIEKVGLTPKWLWYEDRFVHSEYSAVIIPGGFSYGDYLRSGALASRSPVMDSVREFAEKGYPVMGICNGFQILCEAKLLPGALVKNESLKFIDKWVQLKQHGLCEAFGQKWDKVRLPIAHGDGRYFISEEQLKILKDNDQIWLTYQKNPNGSVMDIAGVMNVRKNVAGMMPHPERAMASWMGGSDGLAFFETIM